MSQCPTCGQHLEQQDDEAKRPSPPHSDTMIGRVTGHCRHDWMDRGTPDDQWRECFLCGETEDA